MDIAINHDDGVVYIGLGHVQLGETAVRTTYLGKHGLYLHWNGRGTLLGVEVRQPGEQINVYPAEMTPMQVP